MITRWFRKSIAPPAYDAAELFLGVVDVMMAFGVVLANRGLLTREEIADMMGHMVDHQRRQPGDTPSRRLAAETLQKIFAAPVMEGGHGRAGLVALDGGKAASPLTDSGQTTSETSKRDG